MGKGDSRTRKGKIYKGSYGNSRLHRVAAAPKVAVTVKAPVAKKAAAKKKA
ncbi:MAG: 30S ribosomal protein THX [Lysobacteraceae bacterium]